MEKEVFEMKKRMTRGFSILIILALCSSVSPSSVLEAEEDCLWIGPDDNVLPFRNDQDAVQFLRTAQVGRLGSHPDGSQYAQESLA